LQRGCRGLWFRRLADGLAVGAARALDLRRCGSAAGSPPAAPARSGGGAAPAAPVTEKPRPKGGAPSQVPDEPAEGMTLRRRAATTLEREGLTFGYRPAVPSTAAWRASGRHRPCAVCFLSREWKRAGGRHAWTRKRAHRAATRHPGARRSAHHRDRAMGLGSRPRDARLLHASHHLRRRQFHHLPGRFGDQGTRLVLYTAALLGPDPRPSWPPRL